MLSSVCFSLPCIKLRKALVDTSENRQLVRRPHWSDKCPPVAVTREPFYHRFGRQRIHLLENQVCSAQKERSRIFIPRSVHRQRNLLTGKNRILRQKRQHQNHEDLHHRKLGLPHFKNGQKIHHAYEGTHRKQLHWSPDYARHQRPCFRRRYFRRLLHPAVPLNRKSEIN